jgi:hypothetical protein
VNVLFWRDGIGRMVAGGSAMTLLSKPTLPFQFDSIEYQDGVGLVRRAERQEALSPAEAAAVFALFAPLERASNEAKVHGADGEGRYLGLVAERDAAHVLEGPPPFAVDEAQWDATTKRWLRMLTPGRKARDVRRERDARLAATDFTQVQDSPLNAAKRAEWRAYRQALRDLPQHPRWPDLLPEDWPARPA